MADTVERKYGISRYKSRYDKDKTLQIQHLSWEEVVALLSDFKRTNETFKVYESGSSLDKLAIKDVGYFVGGVFNPPQRKTFNLVGRSLLTLDLDHLQPFDEAEINATYGKLQYLVHSSHSHSPDKPRLRIVFPLSRDVKPAEYEALARMVASKMGMDYFDDTTYQFSRIMFLPSVSIDGETYLEVNEGRILDVDKVLGMYDDPEDYTKWPRSSREGRMRPSALQAENAYSKGGIIGAFNRSYTVPEAIEAFDLPYVESGLGEGRYSYAIGTSADGAVYYPDDGHLFSHHESDPAKGNHHAFDLVRIHKFLHEEDPLEQTAACGARPSDKAMAKFAAGLDTVSAELRRVQAEADFEDVSGEDAEEEGETPERPKKQPALGYKELVEMVLGFNSEPETSIHEQANRIILELAVARLEPHEEEMVLVHFQQYAKQNGQPYTKAALVKAVAQKTKALVGSGHGNDLQDIQVEFIRHFMDTYYEGGKHLRRTGQQWWIYTSTHWERRSDEFIKGQLADTLVDLRTNSKTRKKAKQLAAAVGENQTSNIAMSLWTMLCSSVTVYTETKGSATDPMGMLRTGLKPAINCLNGTIWFTEDGRYELRDSDPDDLFTSVVNVRFNPKAECPTWMNFCRDAFSKSRDPHDMQRHLEELFGYVLNQSRDLRTWVLLYGKSGSGKSTAGSLLLHMLGDAAKVMPMGNYSGNNSHATAGLIGKLLLLDDDFNSGDMLNDGFIKSISTEKRMGANPKGKEEFNFVSRVVPMILSNSPPVSKDTSEALADRALVFPFNHAVPRELRDLRLPHKLEREAEGVFYRCVRAYARLVQRGDWQFPLDCTVAWEAWRSDSNPILTFVSACLVKAPTSEVPASQVWDAYQIWMREESGELHLRGGRTRNKFYQAVDSALNMERVRGQHDSWKVYKGYELRPGIITDDDRDSDFDDESLKFLDS